MAEDTVPTRRPLNKKGAAFIKKLDKERVKNANTSARSKGTSSSGTFGSSERMADVKKDRGVQRGKGELVRRPDYSVTEYKKPGTSVVEVKRPNTAVVEYKGPSASTAASNVAGKVLGRGAMRLLGPAGALVGMTEETNKGEREFMDMIRKKAGKGYGDKPVGPFKPAAKTTVGGASNIKGTDVKVQGGMGMTGYNTKNPPKSRVSRPDSYSKSAEKYIYGSNAKPLSRALVVGTASDTKFENSKNNPVRKAQYNRGYVPWAVGKVKDSAKSDKEAPVVKKAATDKSRLAPKTTNYQRMQAKQLEKEGYAGRSLTRAQAQKMAGAKSGANTTSLMVLFGISKPKTDKKVAAPTKRTGPLKSAFAQISYQGRKK